MPLEQLKKDPAYRALARRYSSLIVALPFAIVSSYFLYGRCEWDFLPFPLLLPHAVSFVPASFFHNKTL